MCFYTGKNGKNPPEPLIAKEDIECWKLLTDKNHPYYQMLYIKGKCEPYKNGFHYYKENEEEFRFAKVYYSDDFYQWGIEEGFHSLKKKPEDYGWIIKHKKIKRFIIPKGAKYYQNEREYVSSEIIAAW